jgi:CHASE2 domain-containing sensor protein
MRGHPHRGFWPYFLHGALFVFAAAGLTYWLHDMGVFDRWENNNLDRFLFTKKPSQSKEIVLVVIDEDDYRGEFESKSPLAAQRVVHIIEAIRKGKPEVIGVDLDTSQWILGENAIGKPDANPMKVDRKEIAGWHNVVWARDGWTENGQFQMAPVLGDDPTDICFGLPALRLDDDGVVRRFLPVYNAAGEAPGFSTTVIRLSNAKGEASCKIAGAPAFVGSSGEHERLINFLGSRDSFRKLTASSILALANTEEWQKNSDVDGKIVLLGGTFRAARDRFSTPVGALDGVEVLAHILETELHPLEEAQPWHYVAADVALGLVLLVGLYPLAPVWRIVGLLSSFVLAIFASYLVFQTSSYFFSFVPVIAGVRVHQVIEQYFEGRELKRENQELRSKLARRG